MPTKKPINQSNELALDGSNLPAFISPLPVDTKISQGFGARPSFYLPLGFLGHPGIDYAVSVGTDVHAVNWGLVLKVGNDPKGWGHYVKIQHGDLISLYAHLSYIDATEGCYVTRGQLIAKSGNTGLSSGPHLHLGILDPTKYNNGYKGYQDPMPLLKPSEAVMTEQLRKIAAEIAQIKKDNYDPKSLYIHVKYIEDILDGRK